MSQQPPGDPAARRQPPRQGATGDGGRGNLDPAADPVTRQRQPSREMPTGAPGSDPAARPSGRAVGPVYGAAQPRSGEPSDASARPPAQPRADRPVRRSESASDPGAARDPFTADSDARGRPRDPFAPDAGDARVTRRVAGQDPYADPYSSPDPFDDFGPDPGDESFAPPRRATRPTGQIRSADPDLDDPTDPSAWGDGLDDPYDDPGWDDLPDEETPVARRPRPARRPAGRRAPRPAVALPSFRMPAGLLSGDLVGDRIASALFAASLAGALLMAIVLLTQIGRLPEVLVVHLDAAGIPDRWGTPRVLWRLPLIAFGVTLMNAVVAWYVARLDRFAARFVLAAALVVQIIAWAALFSLL